MAGLGIENEETLARRISLPWLTLYGLGTTVGAGIYVLVGKVAGEAGGLAPLSFILAAALAGMTAFSFAELSRRMPKSAGEALYVREGFRSNALSLAVGLAVALAGIISSAAILNGAAGYLQDFLPLSRAWLIVGATLLLGGLAIWGIAQSVVTAGLITLVEIGGLLAIVGAGVFGAGLFGAGLFGAELFGAESLTAGSDPSSASAAPLLWGGVLGGSLLAFYAFIGFEDMVNVAEEVRDVERVLPRAIVWTLVLTTLLYLAVTLVAIRFVPTGSLAESSAPLALVWERASGLSSRQLSAVAVVATLNGALIQIIMASRVFYGLARQGSLPGVLGRINPHTRTPVTGTLLVVGLILIFALALPIERLASITSLLTLAIFTLVNLALWRIKRREGEHEGGEGFTVPRAWPLLAAIASLSFAAVSLLS